MNTNFPSTSRPRKRLSQVALILLGAAALAPFAVSQARADVRVGVGVSIGTRLPHGYSEVRVGRDRYFTQRGVFYRHGPHGYVVVRAPRGAIIRTLPPHYTRIYVGPTLYYRYGDVYYQPVRDGYVVVEAPAPQSLPPSAPPIAEYQSVWVGKEEYLFKDGQFFTKTADGMVWTQAPLGAITKELPADSHSVWFQNEEYFESDEVYFHKTPSGYEVVTAPWKK